jgi:hypothetical protein
MRRHFYAAALLLIGMTASAQSNKNQFDPAQTFQMNPGIIVDATSAGLDQTFFPSQLIPGASRFVIDQIAIFATTAPHSDEWPMVRVCTRTALGGATCSYLAPTRAGTNDSNDVWHLSQQVRMYTEGSIHIGCLRYSSSGAATHEASCNVGIWGHAAQ